MVRDEIVSCFEGAYVSRFKKTLNKFAQPQFCLFQLLDTYSYLHSLRRKVNLIYLTF